MFVLHGDTMRLVIYGSSCRSRVIESWKKETKYVFPTLLMCYLLRCVTYWFSTAHRNNSVGLGYHIFTPVSGRMVGCSVIGCTNRSGAKDVPKRSGVTFHRFPKEPIMRSKWVDALNRKDWTPTKYSCLCSEHFRPEDINRTSLSSVRIRDGVIPSLFPDLSSDLQTDSKDIKREQKKATRTGNGDAEQTIECPSPSSAEPVPQEGIVGEESSIPDKACEKPSVTQGEDLSNGAAVSETPNVSIGAELSIGAAVPENPNVSQGAVQSTGAVVNERPGASLKAGPPTVAIINGMAIFYPAAGPSSVATTELETPAVRKMRFQLEFSARKIREKNKKLKDLRQVNRRLKMRLEKLEHVVKQLKSKNPTNDGHNHWLTNVAAGSSDPILRQLNKGMGKKTHLYPPELCDFALTLHSYSPRAYAFVRKTFSSCLPHPRTLSRWCEVIECTPELCDVREDDAPCELAEGVSPCEVGENGTPSDIADDETPSEIADDETPSEIADDEKPSEIADDEAPSEIADDEALSEIADDEALSEIADDETPSEIADDETPSEVAVKGTDSKVADNVTAIKVADNVTAIRVAHNGTAIKVADNVTAIKVAEKGTLSEVANDSVPSDTPCDSSGIPCYS